MRTKQILPLLLIIIVSIAAYTYGLHHYFSFDTLRTHQDALKQFVQTNLLISIMLYMLMYIIVVLLSVPIAAFMTIISGFLFGQWIGVSAVIIAATTGSTLLFITAKNASKGLIKHKAHINIQKMQKGFKENAFSYLLTLRLIPIFPFAVVNFAAAFFQIPLQSFVMGTLLGITPASFIYSSIGVSLQELVQIPDFSPENLLDSRIIFALSGLGILALLPVLYKYLKGRQQ